MSFDIANDFFLDFIKSLNRSKVSFLLVGGYAVNYYGYNRTTADMDILVRPENQNKKQFVEALIYFGYERAEVEEILQDDFRLHQCYTFGSMPNHIDVLTILHRNKQYDDMEKHAEVYTLDNGESLKIIPFQSLVDIKLTTGRPKDLQDAGQLMRLRNLTD